MFARNMVIVLEETNAFVSQHGQAHLAASQCATILVEIHHKFVHLVEFAQLPTIAHATLPAIAALDANSTVATHTI